MLPANPPLASAPDKIPEYKHQMDQWFHAHQKLEREVQQWMVRINNRSSIAKSSDYYIVDMEYAGDYAGSEFSFDMVAVKWPSTSVARKGQPSALALIELKCGDKAVATTKDNPGIQKHLEDMEKFIEDLNLNPSKWANFKQNIQKIFQQKCELDLITGTPAKTIDLSNITCPKTTEKIFVCAEHDPASSILYRELWDIKKKIEKGSETHPCLYFTTVSVMGYGLYQDGMRDLNSFLQVG